MRLGLLATDTARNIAEVEKLIGDFSYEVQDKSGSTKWTNLAKVSIETAIREGAKLRLVPNCSATKLIQKRKECETVYYSVESSESEIYKNSKQKEEMNQNFVCQKRMKGTFT